MALPDYVLNGQDVSQKPQKSGLPDYVLNQPDIADTSHPLSTEIPKEQTGVFNRVSSGIQNRTTNINKIYNDPNKTFPEKALGITGESTMHLQDIPFNAVRGALETKIPDSIKAVDPISNVIDNIPDSVKQGAKNFVKKAGEVILPQDARNVLSETNEYWKTNYPRLHSGVKAVAQIGSNIPPTKALTPLATDTVKGVVDANVRVAKALIPDSVQRAIHPTEKLMDEGIKKAVAKHYGQAVGFNKKNVKNAGGMKNYINSKAKAIEEITNNQFNVDFDPAKITFESVDEAISKTLPLVHKKYHGMLKGVDSKVDVGRVVDSIVDPMISSKAKGLVNPETQVAAQKIKDRFAGQVLDVSETENVLSEIFAEVKKLDRILSDGAVQNQAQIFVKIRPALREALYKTVDKAGYPEYRQIYGAMAEMKDEIFNKYIKEVNKVRKGLFDVSPIEASGMAWGVMVNPKILAPVLAHKIARHIYTKMKSADYNLQKLFKETDKFVTAKKKLIVKGDKTPPKSNWEGHTPFNQNPLKALPEQGSDPYPHKALPEGNKPEVKTGNDWASWSTDEPTVKQPTSRSGELEPDKFTKRDPTHFENPNTTERININGKEHIWNESVNGYATLADDAKIKAKQKPASVIDIEGKLGKIEDETSMLEGSYSDKSKGKGKGFGEAIPESNLQSEVMEELKKPKRSTSTPQEVKPVEEVKLDERITRYVEGKTAKLEGLENVAFINPSAKEKGMFQLTVFDKKMKPLGDTQHESFAEALSEAKDEVGIYDWQTPEYIKASKEEHLKFAQKAEQERLQRVKPVEEVKPISKIEKLLTSKKVGGKQPTGKGVKSKKE